MFLWSLPLATLHNCPLICINNFWLYSQALEWWGKGIYPIRCVMKEILTLGTTRTSLHENREVLARSTYPDPYLHQCRVSVSEALLLDTSCTNSWTVGVTQTGNSSAHFRDWPRLGKCTGHDPGRGSTGDKGSKYFHSKTLVSSPTRRMTLRTIFPFLALPNSPPPCQWEWPHVKFCHGDSSFWN